MQNCTCPHVSIDLEDMVVYIFNASILLTILHVLQCLICIMFIMFIIIIMIILIIIITIIIIVFIVIIIVIIIIIIIMSFNITITVPLIHCVNPPCICTTTSSTSSITLARFTILTFNQMHTHL